MRKFITAFLIILSSAAFSLYAENPRFIINSGHTGAPSSLDYLEKENLLFSGSYDGTIKVWDGESGKIKYQMQVSHLPVRKIEACPGDRPYVAAVISDGINSTNLTVWNWQTGKKVFRHRLTESPLFLLFSPKGSFLMYGKTDWDSLVFLDSETGKQQQLIPEGFGIVSNAFISPSEKTLLTYNNSGSIQYWDLVNGTRKTKISTLPDLEQIAFTSSGRFMTGYSQRELLLIDLTNGSKIGTIDSDNLSSVVIDPQNDKTVWVEKNPRDIRIKTAAISGTGFSNIDETVIRSTAVPTALFSTGGRIFTAYQNGDIFEKESWSDDTEIFAANNLLNIQDFAINETSLATTAPGKLLSISSDFFTNDVSGNINPEVVSKIINTDANASYGLSAGHHSDFLLWESDSPIEGSIRIFNGETGEISTLSELTAPLISAEYKNGSVLTLDRNGECRILGYSDGREQFKYTYFGLRAVDFIDGRNIIAGRNNSSMMPSPLLHINTLTGETVPIEDSNLLIFDLEYDELTRKLYTIGFEERDGIMRTVLKQHTGRNHDRAETIFAVPGENIDASFASDANSSKIFTSLGSGGVKMLYWGGFTPLETTFSIPKTLKLSGNILAALNQDSSFTIFNLSNGAKLMDLFIFRDLSWAALLADNKIYASQGAEKYINVYDGNTDKELRQSRFMFR